MANEFDNFLDQLKESYPIGDSATNGEATMEDPQPASDDEYDPDSFAASYPVDSVESPSDQSASMPESAAETPQEQETAESSLKQPPADAAAPTPTKQPRTMGGFVMESEDDDEDDVSESKAGGTPSARDAPQQSLSQSPTNTSSIPNVPLQNVQDQDVSGVSSGVSASATVSNVALSIPDAVPDNTTKATAQDSSAPISARPSVAPTPTVSSSLPKPRLPQDHIGIFEDRIAEDPRGDMDAWRGLISEYTKRAKYPELRALYERFFKMFPGCAEEYVNYANLESSLDQFQAMEHIFAKSIPSNPHVELLLAYLNYIRRRHNLTTDTTGNARKTITDAYEFVLSTVGNDVNAGKIWKEYLEFLKSGPGTVGGSSWQDMQKMDTLRKVYQRAVAVPTHAVLELWKDYDKFEMGLNRTTGRKYIQDHSQAHMNARAAMNFLSSFINNVNRSTYPKLMPFEGFVGDKEYVDQVNLWHKWLTWEKSDPLDLKEHAMDTYKARVLYLYKQSLMTLRFYPEMWYDAAEFCLLNGLNKEGEEFLRDGLKANPESGLLAFKLADHIETTGEFEDSQDGNFRKGEAVREPYRIQLDALYEAIKKAIQRSDDAVARFKESQAGRLAALEERLNQNRDDEDFDGEAEAEKKRAAEEDIEKTTQAIKNGMEVEILKIKRLITFSWISLMQTMRRIQGKGDPYATGKGVAPGFRGIFIEARQRGHLLSEAYIMSAKIEHICYQDAAATKIFERGMKLFPNDANFALEYISHLINQHDITNARSVFETAVNRMSQKPENIPKTYWLFKFMYEHESRYGELAQMKKLEQRMKELFPDMTPLQVFELRSSYYSLDGEVEFHPTWDRPVISPRTQMEPIPPMPPAAPQSPPAIPQQTIERPATPPPPVATRPQQPVPHVPQITHSPKRPYEESDSEAAQPRKIMRGESPLKGAAGRRLVDAARRNMRGDGGANVAMGPAPPAPLPREINFLLSIIPPARTYQETRFDPARMVALLHSIDLTPKNQQYQAPAPVPQPPVAQTQMGWGQQPQYPGYYQ